MALLGLDIGSSGCKASVISADGRLLGQTNREYPSVSPQAGYQELNPEIVWAAVQDVVSRVLTDGHLRDIAAIGVSSFGEAVVPVDARGQVLHNALLYIDGRGGEEARRLAEVLSRERVLSVAGAFPHPMFSLPKLMWLRTHRPEVLAHAAHVLPFSSFVLSRLGARPHVDYTLAARTLAFDVVRKAWSDELLRAAGVSISLWPEAVPSGTDVGRLAPELARRWGLSESVTLVAGGHDQPCAALGAGAVREGLAVDGLGTTECITPVFGRPVFSTDMASAGFACVPHVLPDLYVTYAFTFTNGSLLKWYKDTCGQLAAEQAAQSGVNPYGHLIRLARPEPSNLLVLPHFAGAATPYMDPLARGAIVGLTLGTTEGDLIKGILEGLNYEMMVNVDHLGTVGIGVDDFRCVGGLAQSEVFLQLKADMFGKRVTSLQFSEAGTLGVAILAGSAVGLYASIDEGVAQLVKVKREFVPDMEKNAVYRTRLDTYRKLYPTVRELLRGSDLG